MQTWKHNDTTHELSLTAAVALRLKAYQPELAILDDPNAVLRRLIQPDTLLPVAVAMMEPNSGYTLQTWEKLAEGLRGECYENLRTAVEAEILDFFHGELRETLNELIELQRMERRQILTEIREELTASRGSNRSSNGPESSESTGDTPPPANSNSSSEAGTATTGTTQPDLPLKSRTRTRTASSP